MQAYPYHRGIDLRRGQEASGGDREEPFDAAVVCERRRYRAVFRVAGGGGESDRDFLLDHHGYVLERKA